MSEYYISLSLSELQQWLADDTLPILADRVFQSRVNLDDQTAEVYYEGLFKILPSFALDDPAGVLVAEIAGPASWGIDDDPALRNLELTTVKRFIPLTKDARKILTINWSGSILLKEAVFEKRFARFRLRRKKDAGIKSGLNFLSIFVDYGDHEFQVGEGYKNALPRALMAAENLSSEEINEILGKQIGKFEETWIERCFGYTRHKIINKAESIKSFFDVGIIIRDSGAPESLIGSFRSICERLSNVEIYSLKDVCSDAELYQFILDFYTSGKNGESISVVTLGLFLRWKQRFHDDRSAVNVEAILNDVTDLAGTVDVEVVSNALWMMGAYLGMEYVAPIYRYAHRDIYGALAFDGVEKSVVPVAAWSASEKRVCNKDNNSLAELELSGVPNNDHFSVYDSIEKDQSEKIIDEDSNFDLLNEGDNDKNSDEVSPSKIEDYGLTKEAGVQAEKVSESASPTRKAQHTFKDVPKIEIEEAILNVLREGAPFKPDDVMRAVIKQVGFKRLTGPIRQRLEDIISFLIGEERVQHRNGRLQLNQGSTIAD